MAVECRLATGTVRHLDGRRRLPLVRAIAVDLQRQTTLLTHCNRMLAVMTLNIGYFLSVLGGIFIGELGVGRYSQSTEH